MDDVAIEFDSAIRKSTDGEIPLLSFAQEDVDAFRASVATSGLPELQVRYLEDSGVSASSIDALTLYVAEQDLRLTTSSTLSPQQVVQAAATVFQVVPEPSSITLFGLGSLGLLGYFRRRRNGEAVEELV